uniref:Uncharacterized protein n=1 Tax=Membranoptera weeksiae TaxID=158720 RepID=A0A1L1WAA6_9FLOR|nr:hypothetical protein [Membranoptera weeksiae]AIC36836.1 hypothetical protein [Membranoptera weeksiae]
MNSSRFQHFLNFINRINILLISIIFIVPILLIFNLKKNKDIHYLLNLVMVMV